LITGDFVTRIGKKENGWIVETLGRLRNAARDGVWGVMGNHDWWTNEEGVANAVQRAGVTLLRNAYTQLWRGGESLYLAGVDDYWEAKADLARALSDIPMGATTVLMAHEPDFADVAALDERVSLQVSGHSHGGQVRLPGLGALALPRHARKYPMGWYQVNRMQLYTNRGVGMITPAVRFNCRPEITLFTLLNPPT
jgi:hypothetical protein